LKIRGIEKKRTGIFYHEICGKEAYKSLAMSVEEGFESLKGEDILSQPNVILFESEPASEEEIAKIHTQRWINYVKQTQWLKVSLYSIGGVLGATEKVLKGEINNALVFCGVGGHHAHPDDAWGGCYFNDNVIAINYAREKLKGKRFAIVDTDTHHADGTRDIFKNDEEVLHLCFCGGYSWNSLDGGIETKTKICFPHGSSDESEIEIVRKEVPGGIEKFKPELIYWVCGLDTHKESYGTRSLTEKCYPKLAEIIKETADRVCQGKLVIEAACNAPAQVSEFVMPRILDCLAEIGKYPK